MTTGKTVLNIKPGSHLHAAAVATLPNWKADTEVMAMTEQIKAKQEAGYVSTAQTRHKQFKKMNNCISITSFAIALYLGRECQTTECWEASPGYNFVWLFALAVMVGVIAETYFVWLEDKEGKP